MLTRVPDGSIVSIKVYQDPCVPAEESCEEGVDDTEPTVDDVPMETDTEVNDVNMVEEEEEPAKPPLDWYLGVSEDLKVMFVARGQLDLFY
jgi:hypothetical protein